MSKRKSRNVREDTEKLLDSSEPSGSGRKLSSDEIVDLHVRRSRTSTSTT